MKVMTFNIRFDNPADDGDLWRERKLKVAATLEFFEVDAAGLQEALIGQIRDLESLLPGHGWLGVGRDDGVEKGEFCPVFFKRSRLLPLGSATFWLSEEPDRPGVPGWNAACPRLVTVVEFRDLATGREFFFYNTHFDHVSEKARMESARLLIRDIGERTAGRGVIVTGDLNCTASSEAYCLLTGGYGDAGQALIDARTVADGLPYGSTFTFNEFSQEPRPGWIIDHIFFRNASGVKRWGVISDIWDGRFASDHFPVLAEIVLDRR